MQASDTSASTTQEVALRTVLDRLAGEEIHFLCNVGNAGDGLIHAGFYELAKNLRPQVVSFYPPEPRQGENLLIMGAGCFCSHAWNMVDPVKYYSKRYKKVYILPATFETTFSPVGDLLRNLPSNVTVFCRERISFEAVLKLVPNPREVFLDHDLAFAIDASPWIKAGQDSLYVFRTDEESRLKLHPSPNYDISAMDREYHHTLLLDILSNFEQIYTDRLHVAIAGALLDKQVHLFRNNYHKIQAIHDYSLHRYPKVKLLDDAALHQLVGESSRREAVDGLRKKIIKIPGARGMLRVLKQVTGRTPNKK